MIKTIKVRAPENKVFFAGCLHHSHDTSHWSNPLCNQRGLDSLAAHDLFQIRQWNDSCDENSIVFLLGDTIFNDSSGEKLDKLLFERLRFKEVWIQPGNHFSGWLQNYKKLLHRQFPNSVEDNGKGQIVYEVYPLSDERGGKTVNYIPNYVEIDVNGKPVVLCHYAIKSWNKMARNSWMLHSHQHLADLDSDLKNISNGKIADLGYETLVKYNEGRPISFEKLKKYMDAKPYKPEGHH